jgi:RimJ/RimL family protein N-acetyltransferase
MLLHLPEDSTTPTATINMQKQWRIDIKTKGMKFILQPILQSEIVILQPLQDNDFEALYKVASDPLVWEQHPNKNRYQREVFESFFKGAMESGGAFLAKDAVTGEVIGSSRFYDLNEEKNEVLIGYTFLGRKYWGGNYNRTMKQLMLDHAFRFVDTVLFHIGAHNIRSQTAIQRIGARKIGEEEIAYYGEQNNLNCIFRIEKKDWVK